MVGHLREGTTDVGPGDFEVPIWHFTSDEHAERERALLRRLPLVACFSSELPEPGSFITRDIMGTPILVVRQPDGAVYAMLNMCRHRGGKVELTDKGKKPVFMCSYHGWSFERDGKLRGVAFKDWYDPMDKACRNLIRVQCEERHGLIFVDLSNDASRSVADFLGPEGDQHLAEFGLTDAVIFMENTFTLEVNWKLVIDGAIDVIHPQFLHPNGVASYIHSGTSVWMDYGRHGQTFSPRRRLAERVKNGETIEAAQHRYFASNFMLYPNSLVIAAPDHYEVWTIYPSTTSATESRVTIRLMIDKAKLNDEMAERLNRSWEILQAAAMDEDWPMEVSIQQNASANPGEGTFIYGRGEVSCQHLHRWLAKDLASPAI